MKKSGKGHGYMHEGMARHNPPGDSGMRPPSGSVNTNTTRDKPSSSHSLGPREK